MKKVLLFSALILALGSASKLNAQCSITNVSLTPVSVATVNGVCQATVNLQYTVALNGGSKHTIIHLWEEGNYPNPSHVAADYPLLTPGTAGMLGTIVIDYQGATPVVLSSWPTGSGNFKANTTPSTPILTPNINVQTVGGNTVVSFTNLVLNLSTCNTAVTIVGDIWATQNDQGASCLAARAITVVANDPVMNGLMVCSSPRSFRVSFKTINTANVTFSVYKDVNGNGALDATDLANGKLNLTGPGIATTAQDVTVNNTGGSTNFYGPYTYDQQPAGSQFSIFVVANVAGNPNNNVLRIDNTCASLPVSFKSFTATRNNQTVAVKWETAFEQNNRGFYVQRNTSGEWKDVAFVFSRADGGNSDQILSYAYNDPNNFSAASYYRITQVDMDGKLRYSDIRIVRGEEQSSKLMLFPNPGTSGKINVLFGEETSPKDIVVYDATGRAVKSFRSVVSSNLTIDHLKTGMYSIQVKNLSTQTLSTDKFIIQE